MAKRCKRGHKKVGRLCEKTYIRRADYKKIPKKLLGDVGESRLLIEYDGSLQHAKRKGIPLFDRRGKLIQKP